MARTSSDRSFFSAADKPHRSRVAATIVFLTMLLCFPLSCSGSFGYSPLDAFHFLAQFVPVTLDQFFQVCVQVLYRQTGEVDHETDFQKSDCAHPGHSFFGGPQQGQTNKKEKPIFSPVFIYRLTSGAIADRFGCTTLLY